MDTRLSGVPTSDSSWMQLLRAVRQPRDHHRSDASLTSSRPLIGREDAPMRCAASACGGSMERVDAEFRSAAAAVARAVSALSASSSASARARQLLPQSAGAETRGKGGRGALRNQFEDSKLVILRCTPEESRERLHFSIVREENRRTSTGAISARRDLSESVRTLVRRTTALARSKPESIRRGRGRTRGARSEGDAGASYADASSVDKPDGGKR